MSLRRRLAATAAVALCAAGPMPLPAGASADHPVPTAPDASGVAPAVEDEPAWPAGACADVIVYVVRGSGEAPQSGAAVQPYNPSNPTAGYAATWDAFDPIDDETGGSSIDAGIELDVDEHGKRTVPTGTPFLYDLVEKVHRRVRGQLRLSWSPIRYPAVPVASGLADAPLWAVRGYPNSVTSGIRELHRTLKRQWENCGSRTRYVLAGYSQGADVVNSYLRGKIITGSSTFGIATATEYLGPSKAVAGQIAAVTLIADPNHDPADPESYSRIDRRLAQKGGLYGFRAGVPEPMRSVTDSICLAGDAVCGRGVSLPDEAGKKIHGNGYRNFVDYPVSCDLGDEGVVGDESAITCMADRIVWRLGVRNLERDPVDEADSAPGTTGRDVAFFIDTTGSMQDDIDSALAFASSEADRIVSLDGRVALVQYRDKGDDVEAEIVVPFTTDMLEFQDGLSLLLADGGGDTPEGLLHALMVGFDGLDWQYGASKAAVILTDAGFHEPDRIGGETLPRVERRSLEIDPVNVFPVVDRVGAYDDLAARTSGEVIRSNRVGTEQALRDALDNIAERPSAVLSNTTYFAAAGREVHLDASASSAVVGEIVEYRWDVDGDGFTDEVTTTPELNHEYPPGYAGVMQVLVVDSVGRSANASAGVLVQEEPVRGLLPRVPSATALTTEASGRGDHVTLEATWSGGAETPRRWVVAVDGDPVDVVPGDRTTVTAQVPFQEEEWRVTVTPMDADGNYGPSVAATLDPLPGRTAWHERPVVWAVGAGSGIGAFVLVLLFLLRRRRPAAPVPGVVA